MLADTNGTRQYLVVDRWILWDRTQDRTWRSSQGGETICLTGGDCEVADYQLGCQAVFDQPEAGKMKAASSFFDKRVCDLFYLVIFVFKS